MSKSHKQIRILLALEWYSRQIHRGVASFAKQANWILDTQMSRGGLPPSSWQGDGIICMLGRTGKLSDFVKKAGVPSINLAWRDCPLDIPMVLHDDKLIARTAAEHFTENGFQNLAFYRSEDRSVAYDRMSEFQNAARKAKLNFTKLDLAVHKSKSKNNPAWRQKWLAKQLMRLTKPLGVFAQNDDHAVEVLYACESAGISVPQNVAIIGCDNEELICTLSSVPLTSIDTNQYELGYQSARRLDNMIRRNQKYSKDLLVKPGGIIVRKSSDVTAVSDPNVAEALEFINENASQIIGVSDVVSAVGISRRKLYLAFEAELGCGIAEVITRRRINIAKRLIKQTNYKLHKVAKLSGFANLQHMRNTFVRKLGSCPSKLHQI